MSQFPGGQLVATISTTDYGSGTSYALGAPVSVTSTSTRSGASTTSRTLFGYDYFDGP